MPYTYTLYGLSVCSDIELPELAPLDHLPSDGVSQQVTVSEEILPKYLLGGRRISKEMTIADNSCLYAFPGTGRFLVEDGSKIWVDVDEGASKNAVRAFLYGSAFGTVLHQLGSIPLHISAVSTPSGLTAFTSDSGGGKSTMAGMLNMRTGWPVLTDDVAVLRSGDKGANVFAGILGLKLWQDAISMLELDEDRLTRDVMRHDKFHFHAPEIFTQKPARLRRIMLLKKGDVVRLSQVKGAEKLSIVMNSIYRPYLVGMFGDRNAVWSKCVEVSNEIDVYLLERPWNTDGLIGSADLISSRYG